MGDRRLPPRGARDSRFTKDGWLRTGEIGQIDPLGFVEVTDHAKELITSGGEWISSADLENGIAALPGVAEAAVYQIHDTRVLASFGRHPEDHCRQVRQEDTQGAVRRRRDDCHRGNRVYLRKLGLNVNIPALGELPVERQKLTQGECAGYSRGLASNRFGSKETLFSFLVRDINEKWAAELRRFVGKNTGRAAIEGALDAAEFFLLNRTRQMQAMYILRFESISSYPPVRRRLAANHIAYRKDTTRWLRRFIVIRAVRAQHCDQASPPVALRCVRSVRGSIPPGP